MVQSIKTEVIYYGMDGDFEFEFNLCGCCQMRMLKESVNDNAALLKALQRGIIRSRVIIIVGNILGESGTISLVSKAIGYACETLDTDIYEINSDEPITIIKNSVPLITKNGTFGGCIIESGPQSMIFLSDDKKIRKEVMSSLVNSYITDLSRFPTQLQTDNEIPAIEDKTEETDNIELENVNEVLIEQEVEQTVDGSEPPMEFEDFSTYSDEAKEAANDPYNIANLPTSEDVDIVLDEESDDENDNSDEFYETNEANISTRSINIATLILSILLLVLLGFIVYSFVYLPLSNGISVSENFKNIFSFLKGA